MPGEFANVHAALAEFRHPVALSAETADRPREITDEAADKAARTDAWPRVVAFIRQLETPE